MPKFPHVGNDDFPHLENARPFARTVPFDYSRYDYTASIKLCSVPWPMDYKHVVNWQSAAARDAWFDGLAGHVIELPNGFTRTQTDTVRVNVPYDVALTYNYVFMRVPVLTPDDPIHHEGENGVRTVCAWIQDAIYYAPSSTELVLSVDYWTTYLPHLADVSLMLHRGHAPAYAVDVDDYLDDPKAHCANLLTPDISYGTPDVAASSRLVNIAQGEKLLVLASTIPYADLESLVLAQAESGSSTAATFFDTGARNGHQVGVNGYEWHYGGYSYASMNNPSRYSGEGDAMPAYTYLYAIATTALAGDLTTLARRLPQFIKSTQAAYLIPRAAVTLAPNPYSVAGASIYRVIPNTTIADLATLDLNRAAFGYPTAYSDIAKLYTFPYAHLIVSDTLGREIDVRIEDMGSDARISTQLSPMVECLRWDVLLEGVNDAGANAYRWTMLDGTSRTLDLPGADVARYTLPLDIPTYALYLDARTAGASDGYYNAQAKRAQAVNAYQATMRGANTGMENAIDSADTAKENADASADTAKANADASANTSVTNTANSGSNAQANAVIANNLRTTSTSRNNTAQSDLTGDAVQNIYDSSNADLEYTEYATDVNLKSEAIASIQNMVGNAIAGNAMGVINSGVSGIVNITTSESLASLSLQNVLDHQAIAQSHTRTGSSIHISNATAQAAYANTANTRTTNNNVSTNNTNATNSANTAKANATRSQTTAKANATRARNTSAGNAGYSRSTTEENAKAALELARQDYERQGHARDMDNPVSFGLASGDRSPDALMRRVVQVRIETQSAAAIARAGDAMRRYGYVFDGFWTVDAWCPTDHDGCYWEASDVLVSAASIDNAQAERAFESILMEGTTVWNDPAKIGGMPW